MLKPLLSVSAVILFGVAVSSTPGLTSQEAGAGARSQGKPTAASMTRAKQI